MVKCLTYLPDVALSHCVHKIDTDDFSILAEYFLLPEFWCLICNYNPIDFHWRRCPSYICSPEYHRDW